jgi:hypothetical protein
MPVRLSEEDLRDPAHSRIVNIHHEFDPECDGLVCSIESALRNLWSQAVAAR